MGMQFFLRTDCHKSNFRSALNELLSTTGDTLILSSGYISKSLLNDYNYSDFITSLQTGFKNESNPKIIIIGGMFDKNLKNQYEFEGFIKYLIYLGYQVTYHKPKHTKWHAKIALKLINNTPIIGIIGSSNLTAPSYSQYPTSISLNFNIESDILIWDKEIHRNFRGINYLSLNEHEFQQIKQQKMEKELITLYDLFQKHPTLNTLSQEQLLNLTQNPEKMLDRIDYLIYRADTFNDEKFLQDIFDSIFIIYECHHAKNLEEIQYNFEINGFLDITSKLGESKILDSIYSKLKHLMKISEIYDSNTLRNDWFLIEEHKILTQEIEGILLSPTYNGRYNSLVELMHHLGAFLTLNIIGEHYNYRNILVPTSLAHPSFKQLQLKFTPEINSSLETRLKANPLFKKFYQLIASPQNQ